MPSETRRQQRFMGAEYGRAKAGKRTKTGMSKDQLRDFTKLRKPTRSHSRSMSRY